MKQKLFCVLSATILVIGSVFSAQAANVSTVYSPATANRIIMPRADEIVYKYRVYNGVRQYRRWNETKQCWVDPIWLNL